MTFEEQQEYKVLCEMIKTKGTQILIPEYNLLTKNITGDSEYFIKERLIKKGYLIERKVYNEKISAELHQNYRYEDRISITNLGEEAYNNFKKRKKIETVQIFAFWILFVAAIVSAVYAVLTFYSDASTKNQQSPTTTLHIKKPKTDTYRRVKPHTRPDTTNPKRKVSLIDTAKTKRHYSGKWRTHNIALAKNGQMNV